MSNPNTIFLKSGREGAPIQKELKASEAITPGHLLEFASATTIKKHATAGGPACRRFAVENSLEGNGISDAYAAADRVQYIECASGDEVYAWLNTGQDVSVGDYLESAGDGTLAKSSGEASEIPGSIIAQALEAKDNDASADVEVRIKVVIV